MKTATPEYPIVSFINIKTDLIIFFFGSNY